MNKTDMEMKLKTKKQIIWVLFEIILLSIVFGILIGLILGGFASFIEYQTTIGFIDHFNLTSQFYNYSSHLNDVVDGSVNVTGGG